MLAPWALPFCRRFALTRYVSNESVTDKSQAGRITTWDHIVLWWRTRSRKAIYRALLLEVESW